MASSAGRSVAVIGAGWAGLAAATHAVELGLRVHLYEMARHVGGRARSVTQGGVTQDNGQHILVGAYRDTLALMRMVGVEPDQVLHRMPLTLAYPDGSGLRLPPGPAVSSFAKAVVAWHSLRWTDRLGLLAWAGAQRWRSFRCPPGTTVAELGKTCPRKAYQELIEPLCVAALNTPADTADAQVLLTVLRDALFGPPGAADMLLPKAPLDDLLPAPALQWLARHGATISTGSRVMQLALEGDKVTVDQVLYDHVIVATPPGEASRLTAALSPAWSQTSSAFAYQPIVTAWLRAPGVRWRQPIMAFRGDSGPAQFGFELGQLGGEAGEFAMVISGAEKWVQAGSEPTAAALLAQWKAAFPHDREGVKWHGSRVEKRATFACTPGLIRPPLDIHPQVSAAGDYIRGPYPATLEGAVRSGIAAAARAGAVKF